MCQALLHSEPTSTSYRSLAHLALSCLELSRVLERTYLACPPFNYLSRISSVLFRPRKARGCFAAKPLVSRKPPPRRKRLVRDNVQRKRLRPWTECTQTCWLCWRGLLQRGKEDRSGKSWRGLGTHINVGSSLRRSQRTSWRSLSAVIWMLEIFRQYGSPGFGFFGFSPLSGLLFSLHLFLHRFFPTPSVERAISFFFCYHHRFFPTPSVERAISSFLVAIIGSSRPHLWSGLFLSFVTIIGSSRRLVPCSFLSFSYIPIMRL